MLREKAVEAAQRKANETNETYYAIHGTNGQWLIERKSFIDNCDGRALYQGRQRVECWPKVLT